jgi:hypothetical protein
MSQYVRLTCSFSATKSSAAHFKLGCGLPFASAFFRKFEIANIWDFPGGDKIKKSQTQLRVQGRPHKLFSRFRHNDKEKSVVGKFVDTATSVVGEAVAAAVMPTHDPEADKTDEQMMFCGDAAITPEAVPAPTTPTAPKRDNERLAKVARTAKAPAKKTEKAASKKEHEESVQEVCKEDCEKGCEEIEIRRQEGCEEKEVQTLNESDGRRQVHSRENDRGDEPRRRTSRCLQSAPQEEARAEEEPCSSAQKSQF